MRHAPLTSPASLPPSISSSTKPNQNPTPIHTEARNAKFDKAYTSALTRAQTTLQIILSEIGQPDLPTEKDQALNERDYGDLTGLNKDDARAKWGEEQVHIWRRSYDVPPPNGESLELTGKRTIPYYEAKILPDVLAGKKVLVAAHGNSLRSIIKEIEGLSGEEIVKKELATGVPIVYTLDKNGKVSVGVVRCEEKRD